MRFSQALPALVALSTVSSVLANAAAPELQPRSDSNTVSADNDLEKRDLLGGLLGGLFGGTVNLLTDVTNCGILGKVCTTNWLNGKGSSCVNGVCGAGSCNTLFDFDWALGKCISVASDPQNCGKCGQVCSISGASTAICSSGVCQASVCSPGYTLSAGACTVTINTQSDVNNCGTIGNKCPSSYSNGVGSQCALGVCQASSCNSGFAWDFGLKYCRDVRSDTSNCGACGTVCSFPHGTGTCSSGVCSLQTCNSGYQNVNGVCTAMDLTSDSNNCGMIGKVCSFPNGIGKCSSGVCTMQLCNSGYTLFGNACNAVNTATDVNNCGSVGNKCAASYANGGSAVCQSGKCMTQCNSLFDWDFTLSFCRPVSSDINNCGKCGTSCSVANGLPSCSAGQCSISSCNLGYKLVGNACLQVDTSSDVNNCGSIGLKCPTSLLNTNSVSCVSGKCTGLCSGQFIWDSLLNGCRDCSSDILNCGGVGKTCSVSNGVAKCSSSTCTTVSCNSGYTLVSGACQKMDLTSDNNNCGAIGKICSFPNGQGSCQSSNCQYASCTSPYILSQNTCTLPNTASDISNCGTIGNKCSTLNGTPKCASGVCSAASCNSGYTLTNGQCVSINTQTDVNNCGIVGFKCPTSFLNGNGVQCVSGKCTTQCNNLFGWDILLGACRDCSSDTINCGTVGNVCSVANGVAKCSSGTCSVASCNFGYTLTNGQCTKINTSSDVNNCGLVGLKCPLSFIGGSGVQCTNGICTTTCVGLFGWDSLLGGCRDCSSDTSNCGSVGKACTFPNGKGSCSSGICVTSSCNSGFSLISGSCQAVDTSSDVKNCGSVGNVCSFSNGVGVCSSGKCTYVQCNAPYALISNTCSKIDTTSDPNNCGKVGNVCQSSYLNGGTGQCINSVCTTTCKSLFDWDPLFLFCRDCSSDINNCGTCGSKCSAPYATVSQCSSGQCLATACQVGYLLVNGQCTYIDTTSDTNNCGAIGNKCVFTPTGATGVCQSSTCTYKTCPTGYTLTKNACVKAPSQRARAKKSKIEERTLCPAGETACPILGSASYAQAVTHHFSALQEFSGVMAGAGGYECLDTTQSLDSCGGCASTGEGQDCTKIRGAVGVGCDSGACVVFSCLAGWRPNLAGTKCVRAHTEQQQQVHNSTRTAAPKRHLHARQHLAHSHGHS